MSKRAPTSVAVPVRRATHPSARSRIAATVPIATRAAATRGAGGANPAAAMPTTSRARTPVTRLAGPIAGPVIAVRSRYAVPSRHALHALAFWTVAPGRGELRHETLPPPGAGDVVVRALHSGISRGTESLVFHGACRSASTSACARRIRPATSRRR